MRFYENGGDEVKTEHTTGPWLVHGNRKTRHISPAWKDEASIAEMFDSSFIPPHEQEANAQRIIACVNACEDINPKAIPDLINAAILFVNNYATYGIGAEALDALYYQFKAAIEKATI